MASKLLQSIKARFMGTRRPICPEDSFVQLEAQMLTNANTMRIATEYEARVSLGARYFMAEATALRDEEAARMIPENILRSIAYEIYGEIEQELRLMYPSLHEAHVFSPSAARRLELGFQRIEALCRP